MPKSDKPDGSSWRWRSGIMILTGDATVVMRDNNLAIIARPNSGITKVEDLAGKRVASAAGTDTDKYLKAVLLKNKVPLDKVEFVNIQNPNALAAITGGGVDAVATLEHYGELILARAPGTTVVSRGGGYVAQRIMTMVTQDWLMKNRAVAERLASAYAEAAQYTRQHPEDAGDSSSTFLSGLEPAIARKAVRHVAFDPRFSWTFGASWDAENETLLAQNKIKQAIPISEGFDPAVSEKVLKDHPELFADLSPIPAKP